MPLADELENMRKEIRTDAYPMSIGELTSLYEDGELDIHPEFQRFYRWTIEQKSRLIESILLGIPLPPIFVSQRRADNIWDVVDGLQRLSTILEFMGLLKDEQGVLVPPLRLVRTKYLPSLNGIYWEEQPTEIFGQMPSPFLSSEHRILFKRSKLQLSILLRESDQLAKFELFQRLNRGGTTLSDQEVRNCILVMLNRDVYAWLRRIASLPAFQETLDLSRRVLKEQFDMELLLRFILLHGVEINQLGSTFDISLLLTDRMVDAVQNNSWNLEELETKVVRVFELIREGLGDRAFNRFDSARNRFVGGFTQTGFELIALGLGYNYPNLPTAAELTQKAQEAWVDPETAENSGMGVRASTRIPHTLAVGRAKFVP